MIERMPPHRVEIIGLEEDVSDTLGHLRVESATEALLTLPHREVRVTIDRATRQFAAEKPRALWVADLSAMDGVGTLVPVSPPLDGELAVPVPVRVDDELGRRLRDLRLVRQDCLHFELSLPAGRDRVAILGMRTLAALDAEDARRVTWWIPGGGALELRVDDDGSGGTVLMALGFVPEADAHTANTGPNVLVKIGPRGALPIVGLDEGTGPPPSDVRVLHPARSKLFDAWARYGTIARQENVSRQIERGHHPLVYKTATQQGVRWRVSVQVTLEQCDAWLGPDVQEGREIRVDQSAAVTNGEAELARVNVETVVVRGPGLLELFLRPDRGTAPIPESGTLAARENQGEKVRLEREREALDVLSRGAAACPNLPLLMTTPEVATPPTLETLRPVPTAALDASQEAAVRAIVGCVDLVAVQGPPGTGKTGVFAEALRQIAARGRREGRRYRVLVSSGQNEAITNLVQRLAGVEGVLVHAVERAARDEDEGFLFAARLEEQRERAVDALDARLTKSQVADRLARVREVADTEGELRALAATGPRGWSRLAERLRAVAEDADAPLGHFDREAGRALAVALDEALIQTAVDDVPSGSESAPAGPKREPPSDARAVAAWWEAAGPSWPAESRAAVGAAVAEVSAAVATENAIRREHALKRTNPRLRAAVDATQWSAPMPSSTPEEPLAERIDAWLRVVKQRVQEATESINSSPEAIAWRFLQSLREDPRSWARIVQRHGNAVAATCSMAAKAQPDPGDAYDWVIIDEAGHATPFELLIPMVQGRRIVLIGDHRQLPPMVDDALARRAASDLGDPVDLAGLTLFGELFRLLPRSNALQLGVQYRMHETIGAMVDSIFYRPHGEGLLTHFSGDRVSPKWLVEVDTPTGRQAIPRSRGMFGDAPLVWHDVQARRGCVEENPDEAKAVVSLLEAYAAAGVEHRDIAIICPYRRQRGRIESELRKAELRGQILTIDSVQGREFPVVLLCLVRTDGNAGFLASPNRLNVAISRAQRQLVILGTAGGFLDSDRVRRFAPHLHSVISEARTRSNATKERP